MSRLFKFIIRTSAFVMKEIREVVRQPRLLASLILGPFLILALFGIGYRSEPAVLRTVVVAPGDPRLQQQVEQYASSLGRQLQLAQVISDNAQAELLTNLDPARDAERFARAANLLATYQADVVASFPPDAAQRIERGEPAPLTLYHSTVDPLRDQYIGWFGRVYTDEVNRRVLISVAEQTQGSTGGMQQELAGMREAAAETRAALAAQDRARAARSAQRLDESTDRLTAALAAGVGLMAGVETNVGGSAARSDTQAALAAAQRMQRTTSGMSEALGGGSAPDMARRSEELAQIERDIGELEGLLARFNQIPPAVLAAPFRSVTQNVAAIRPDFVTYYAPGVLALLLQHLAVTIAGLSLVRERLLGAVEVFRVSPLSAFEALLGKYISYTLFCLIVAAALLALLVWGLGVPLQGAVWPPTPEHLGALAVSVLLLIVASLGLGFVISAVSNSDSQAVQLSMIVLLASIFFSGFFLSLDTLFGPARLVAFALPVTYGIRALQATMLRGQQVLIPPLEVLLTRPFHPADVPLLALAAASVVLFILAWILFGRMFRSA